MDISAIIVEQLDDPVLGDQFIQLDHVPGALAERTALLTQAQLAWLCIEMK